MESHQEYEIIKMWYHVMITTQCGKTDGYNFVGTFYNVSTPTIIKYLNEYENYDEIKKSLKGKRCKIEKGLDNNELKLKFCEFIDAKINSNQHFDFECMTKCVNEALLRDKVIDRESEYSTSTVRIWMAQSGYKYGKHSKGIYVDGHQRDDIKQYREMFVNEMNIKE